MPILHLTVRGVFETLLIDSMHCFTKSGSSISAAPKEPFWTLSEGHPKLRLISS